MVRSAIGRVVRKILDKLGFFLIRKEYRPYGISVFNDIARITKVWKLNVAQIIDVGANIGQFAVDAHKHFPAAKVHSFEPHPTSFAQLQDRHLGNWLIPVHCAVGEIRGDTTMFVYGDGSDASKLNSLVRNAGFAVRAGLTPTKIQVECTTLDEYCASQGVEHIQLLKIDTQGTDLSVLRGSRRLLEAGRVAFIYVEFNNLFPKAAVDGGALLPIADYLSQFGYECLLTYTDYLILEPPLFKVCNALFVLPRDKSWKRP